MKEEKKVGSSSVVDYTSIINNNMKELIKEARAKLDSSTHLRGHTRDRIDTLLSDLEFLYQ